MTFISSSRRIDLQLYKFKILAAVITSAALTISCGLIDRTTDNTAASLGNVSTEQPGPANETRSQAGSSEPCRNEFYPIMVETDREYISDSSKPMKYVLSQELKGDAGFMETRRFDSGLIVKNNWICTTDGLRNAEYKNSVILPTGDFEMDTISSDGITFPKKWNSGDKWSTNYIIHGKLSIGPVKAEVDGKITIENELMSLNEKISFDGTDRDTARIDSVIQIDLEMKGRKIKGSKTNMTIWLGRDNGILKQVTTGAFGTETIELVGVK